MFNDTNAILAFERIKWSVEDYGAVELKRVADKFNKVKPGHDPLLHHSGCLAGGCVDTEMTISLQSQALALNRAEALDIAHYLKKDSEGKTQLDEVFIGSMNCLNGKVDDVLMRVHLKFEPNQSGELKIEKLQGKFHLDEQPDLYLSDAPKYEIFDEVRKQCESKGSMGIDEGYSCIDCSISNEGKVKINKF